MDENSQLLSYDQLMPYVLDALQEAGGRASKAAVVQALREKGLKDAPGTGKRKTASQLAYRTGWALTYLKKGGAVSRVERGKWEISDLGRTLKKGELKEFHQRVRKQFREAPSGSGEIRSDVLNEVETIIGLRRRGHIASDMMEELILKLLKESKRGLQSSGGRSAAN